MENKLEYCIYQGELLIASFRHQYDRDYALSQSYLIYKTGGYTKSKRTGGRANAKKKA